MNLRQELARLGWKSVEQWSSCFGHKSETVRQNIIRHWGRDSTIQGVKASAILSDLDDTIRLQLQPAHFEKEGKYGTA